MAFTENDYTPDALAAPAQFSEALADISRCKSWKKWPKAISQRAYERIREDARLACEAFGLTEQQFESFMRDVIDYYIDHGHVMPDSNLIKWESGLFAILRRRIDEAIVRRHRAVLAARRRRQVKAQSAPQSAQANYPQSPDSRDARSARQQPQHYSQNNISNQADLCGGGRAGGASLPTITSQVDADHAIPAAQSNHPQPTDGRDARPARQQPPHNSQPVASKPLPGGKLGRKWRREAKRLASLCK